MTTPDNLEERLRSKDELNKGNIVRVDMQLYLDNAGKYALAANTKITQNFMSGMLETVSNGILFRAQPPDLLNID